MQQLKQLLPVGNKPAIRHCLDTMADAGIHDIIAVLGHRGQEIEKLISGYAIMIVFNADPESEMADSVRIGLQSVDDATTGVMVCLADHPLVSADTLKEIVRLHGESPEKIQIPFFKARRGHPTLFPRDLLDELSSGNTLRDIITSHPERVQHFETQDEGVILDMDTPDDYQRVIDRARTKW